VCPCVVTVAEVGERRRGPEKRVTRWQRGAWTGTQLPEDSQGSCGGSKASDDSIAVAKPRRWNRPEPDARKGVAGQGSSPDGRHLGSFLGRSRSRELAEGGLGGSLEFRARASVMDPGGEATGVSEVRSARIATGRQRPPRWTRGVRAARRSELLCRAAGNLSGHAGAQASDVTEADEARVLIRRSEMAEVGPTHRASQRSASRKASRRCEAGRGAPRTTC